MVIFYIVNNNNEIYLNITKHRDFNDNFRFLLDSNPNIFVGKFSYEYIDCMYI